MLELKNICLNYSYKSVLKGINLSLEDGKIYSLLGENGAGKTTMARIICGDIKQTKGHILLNGKPANFSSPKAAIESGIYCVHQRPLLSPSISVLENLKLGIKKFNKQKASELMEKYLQGVQPSTLVRNLSISQCFFTALIAALLRSPKILILDEPSDSIKQTLNNLAAEGLIILIITHNLQEALETANEVILLKDGEILKKCPVTQITEGEIKAQLYGISKTVEPSEKLIRASINEETIVNSRRTKGLKKEIGYIPSDKTFRASNPNLSILQMLTALHPEGKQKDLQAKAEKILNKAQVNIKLTEKCSNLSGGMLQRLILERELAEKPETLFLFNPTQGLDVEATENLYSRLDSIADQGTTVIIEEKV